MADDECERSVVGRGGALKKDGEKKKVLVESHRPLHALGIRRGPQGGKVVEHATDETAVYLVGSQVAIYSCETHNHRFLPTGTKTVEVLAFSVSHNKRYIALSERILEDKTGDVGVQVSVFNFGTMARIRTLSMTCLNKKAPATLDFSRDNKYLVTATPAPDAALYLWQLDKARLLGMSELPSEVCRATISPWAHWSFCSTGDKICRMWRYQDKQLKATDPMAKKQEWTFTSHCWFDDDRVAVATHQGDVLIIDNCELKKVLPRIFKASSPSAPPPAVWSLYSLGRGFAAGGDAGCFSLYERTYDQDYFQSYKKFDTPHKHRLVDLSVSPNEESLLCCYDNNELAHFNLVGVDIVDHEKPEEVQQAFQLLPIGFHSEAVTAVDVCIQKPIVVTASADKQIRIWNFVKHRVEIRQQFPEEALCVSCHPTGLRLLVGFKFKMCMYSVLVDTLHLCQEFPIKQCREVRFSNGGQYFAAVVVNRIFIFNAYSFEPIGHLTGHSSMVKSFTWARNDQAIISAGFEGAIYEWKIDTCKRNETVEYTCKALTFSAVRYDDVNQLVIAVGCRKVAENGLPEGEVTLRVLKLGGVHDQDAPRSIANLGIVESKPSHNRSQTGEIALSTRAQTLFVGTPAGELHVYSWPMKRGNAVPDNVIELHNGEISFVHLTLDERYLLTVGEDGCMFIFDVDVLLEGKAPPRRSFNYSTFDDVAFVLQHDIDEKNREILTLQANLMDEQRSRRHEREKTVSAHATEVLLIKDDMMKTIEACDSERQAALKRLSDTEEQAAQDAARVEAQRLQDIQDLEATQTKRTKDQVSRYELLCEEKNDLIVRYENKLRKLAKERDVEQKRHQLEICDVRQQLEREVQQLVKEKRTAIVEAAAVLKDTEQEHEEELATREKQMKSELDAKEKDRLSAQSEVDGHRRRQEKHDQHIKELQREVHDKQEKLRRRDTKIAELEKSIQALRLEINVRNDTISASEKKILELKKQTAELEKLRYVLTFKFNELRKEVAPKEDTIKAMTGRIDVMDSDLERTGHDREALRQLLVERNEKIRITLHDVHRLNKQLEDKKRVHELLLKELNALLSKTEPKKLIFGLRETIDKYSPKSMKETAKEEEKMVEFERQRFYMEAQLSALKKQNIRRDERVGIDTQRKTEENAILVREVNDLRHQKKLLTQRVLVSDSQLKDVRQASARVSLTPIDNAGEVRAPPRDGRPQQQRPLKPLHDAAVVHSPTPGGPLGKLHRGTTRSLRDLAQLDPVKIAEIIQTVERNGVDMAKQQAEIQRLRDFVQHLLKRLQDTEGMDSADPPVVDAVSPDPAAQADLVIPTALLSNATLLS